MKRWGFTSDEGEMMRLLVVSLATLLIAYSATARAEEFGEYIGDLQVSLNGDGRTLTLLKDYAFKDHNNVVWTAPAGSKVDGASIPKPFWSVIGGPLEGKYRNASVLHDVYCDSEARDWRATHRMFYDGMRASGVEERLADLMYYAVYAFGPRWQVTVHHRVNRHCLPGRACTTQTVTLKQVVRSVATADQENTQKLRQFQRELDAGKQFSLSEIEKLADQNRGPTKTDVKTNVDTGVDR